MSAIPNAEIPIPDVSTFGAAFALTVQTDQRGAVLVAYTRDTETGAVTRSMIRFDLAQSDYIKRRMSMLGVLT